MLRVNGPQFTPVSVVEHCVTVQFARCRTLRQSLFFSRIRRNSAHVISGLFRTPARVDSGASGRSCVFIYIRMRGLSSLPNIFLLNLHFPSGEQFFRSLDS